MTLRSSHHALCLVWLCLLGASAGLAPARAASDAPVPVAPDLLVGTMRAEKRPVSKPVNFVGRVEAIEKVEIRARVTGFIEKVLFREGDAVATGAPLYRIEREPFAAALVQAEGALLKSKGQLANATAQRERAEQLLKTQSGSAAVRDQRLAEEATAQGDVAMAEAEVETAKINLGYTEIVAPIAGVIGRTSRTKGNVVSPDSGVLATIVSRDPIYVIFPVSQREFLNLADKDRRAAGSVLEVGLTFSDGSAYAAKGKIDFVDVTVDRATDTVNVRAIFPNPDGLLIDGQLVRVAVQSGTPEAQVLVPQTALVADQRGVYVFVVEDGKAVVRRVEAGGDIGTDAIIRSGLSGGEQVIVEGIERVRPGAAVTASPVTPLGSRS